MALHVNKQRIMVVRMSCHGGTRLECLDDAELVPRAGTVEDSNLVNERLVVLETKDKRTAKGLAALNLL